MEAVVVAAAAAAKSPVLRNRQHRAPLLAVVVLIVADRSLLSPVPPKEEVKARGRGAGTRCREPREDLPLLRFVVESPVAEHNDAGDLVVVSTRIVPARRRSAENRHGTFLANIMNNHTAALSSFLCWSDRIGGRTTAAAGRSISDLSFLHPASLMVLSQQLKASCWLPVGNNENTEHQPARSRRKIGSQKHENYFKSGGWAS